MSTSGGVGGRRGQPRLPPDFGEDFRASARLCPERIPPTGVPEEFWELAPDLAVEVVSPGETAEEVREKVAEYLQAGTRLVWTVYSRARVVVAHTPDGVARTFGAADRLRFPDVLPGFECTVAELFE